MPTNNTRPYTMTSTRLFVPLIALILALVALVPAAARDQLPHVVSAPEARALQLAGRLVLVDIRSPDEWKRTGIAEGAVTVTVHRRDFVNALLKATGGDRTRIIGVICATGGRSAMARRSLERMGFTAVVDVSEGMLGNARGPGWIRRGLPVVAYHGS